MGSVTMNMVIHKQSSAAVFSRGNFIYERLLLEGKSLMIALALHLLKECVPESAMSKAIYK